MEISDQIYFRNATINAGANILTSVGNAVGPTDALNV